VVIRRPLCVGDESKVCCPIEAKGQEVIVVGRLVNTRSTAVPGVFLDPMFDYAIEGDTVAEPAICSVVTSETRK
jgi:hypothetical protein